MSSRRCGRRPTLAVLILLLVGAAGSRAAPAQAAPASVSVFPSPGTSYNLPDTQIVFRGVPPGEIGSVEVVGSVTGAHAGQIEADSDGQGGSFLPTQPFAPGETVTVTIGLNVLGGDGGTFSFQIAHPAAQIAPAALPLVAAGAHGVQHFLSRPDLTPAAVAVTQNSASPAAGDIFVAPQAGPLQNGPMILDADGRVLWFLPYPVAEETLITDFREQDLFGDPVLTWWQGNTNQGSGRGHGVIFDQHYRQIASVYAGNGLQMDLHEFLVTPQGQAYIVAVSPVSLPGIDKPVMDSVIQEIDIETGLVLFEWHALDHVPLSQSNFTPASPGHIFDPFHANSVSLDRDGNLLVSMRNTAAVYDVDHQSGAIIWQLGGNASSFTMGTGTWTWGQHDAVMQPDGTLTMFDDGAGPPTVHPYSRAIRVELDTSDMTTTLLQEYDHAPDLSANFEGSMQALPGGDVFLGWGQQPYFSEDTASGRQDFDAHFVAPTTSYRAYRFLWEGQPLTPPDIAVAPGPAGTTDVYASWNGATDVYGWAVLAGGRPGSLQRVASAPRTGFETTMQTAGSARYYAVQALGDAGQALATSPTIAAAPAGSVSPGSSPPPADSASGPGRRRPTRCPRPSGRLFARSLGAIRLGMTRAQAKHAYGKSSSRGKRYEDFFCLQPVGIRVGYASRTLLGDLAPSERRTVRGRVVLALTANGYYELDGIRAGEPVAAATARLSFGSPLQLGSNAWYLAPDGPATAVIKVRRGVVEEIGLADKGLTGNRLAQLQFMTSFY